MSFFFLLVLVTLVFSTSGFIPEFILSQMEKAEQLAKLLIVANPRLRNPERPKTFANLFRSSDLSAGKDVLIALYAYESRADGDLSFRKGEIMYLLDQRFVLY